jgi:hypothetical protein
MSGFSLSAYRAHWPRIDAALALGIGGAIALAGSKLTKPQALSALNFGALLLHQYEEYQAPGYFPGQFNRGLFKSDSPRNYPHNTDRRGLSPAACRRVFNPCGQACAGLSRKSYWLPLSCRSGGREQSARADRQSARADRTQNVQIQAHAHPRTGAGAGACAWPAPLAL